MPQRAGSRSILPERLGSVTAPLPHVLPLRPERLPLVLALILDEFLRQPGVISLSNLLAGVAAGVGSDWSGEHQTKKDYQCKNCNILHNFSLTQAMAGVYIELHLQENPSSELN
jgi:hypothetical protein